MTCNFTSFSTVHDFSHIRMTGDDNERLCAMEPNLKFHRTDLVI